MSDVTLVITSCNRDELLLKTLESFERHNSYPIERVVLTEDGGQDEWRPPMEALLAIARDVIVIQTVERIGQIASIDRAYAHVRTPYIFHSEEDWDFYRTGFIEDSLDVLESDLAVSCVWLREANDRNGHPTLRGQKSASRGTKYEYMAPNYNGKWHGFTFNPGLRRLCDYKAVGPYSRIHPSVPGHQPNAEAAVGKAYFEKGLMAATLTQGYVKHIGWNQSCK
jgi:GT2 family glycosyltransferase